MKAPLTATYGHGTENDFVILFDPDDKIISLQNRLQRSAIEQAALAQMG
ncbi:hypothetical protein EMGBS5_01820 [Clavibacter sp.]|nr:hypothetical protein EMGBS5_01820 [Clavibacter sp.]